MIPKDYNDNPEHPSENFPLDVPEFNDAEFSKAMREHDMNTQLLYKRVNWIKAALETSVVLSGVIDAEMVSSDPVEHIMSTLVAASKRGSDNELDILHALQLVLLAALRIANVAQIGAARQADPSQDSNEAIDI